MRPDETSINVLSAIPPLFSICTLILPFCTGCGKAGEEKNRFLISKNPPALKLPSCSCKAAIFPLTNASADTRPASFVPCSSFINFDKFARSSRSEEHTSELQSQSNLVCRLLLEKKKKKQ